MSEREWKACTWIHHIATVIGLCKGIYHFFCVKRSTVKQNLLLVYIASQVWAAAKLVVSVATGKECMKKSYENIHTLCKNRRKEKVCTWTMTFVSAGFKLGTPVLLK